MSLSVQSDADQIDLGRNLTFGLSDRLGGMIVAGVFARRRFPMEREIGEEFGVSRSVAREAVKMLTAKGLLGARPRTGTYVEPQEQWNLLDSDVLRWRNRTKRADFLEQEDQLRRAVLPVAARLAAVNADDRSVDHIAASVPDRTHALPGSIDEELARFQEAIARASGNPLLSQLGRSLGVATRAGRGERTIISTCRAVSRAIARRDGEAAGAAMLQLC